MHTDSSHSNTDVMHPVAHVTQPVTSGQTSTPFLKHTVTLGGLLVALLVTIVLSCGAAAATSAMLDTPGPRGLKGEQGISVKGERGERGTRGRRGRTGKTGTAGANGANGATIVREEACSNDIDVPLPYC